MCKYLGPPTYPLAIKRESIKLDVKSTDVVIGDLIQIPDHDPVVEYLDYRPAEEETSKTGTAKGTTEIKGMSGPRIQEEVQTCYPREP